MGIAAIVCFSKGVFGGAMTMDTGERVFLHQSNSLNGGFVVPAPGGLVVIEALEEPINDQPDQLAIGWQPAFFQNLPGEVAKVVNVVNEKDYGLASLESGQTLFFNLNGMYEAAYRGSQIILIRAENGSRQLPEPGEEIRILVQTPAQEGKKHPKAFSWFQEKTWVKATKAKAKAANTNQVLIQTAAQMEARRKEAIAKSRELSSSTYKGDRGLGKKRKGRK